MKIFGIGLNKTGTTTLGGCLEILGYRQKGYSKALCRDIVLDGNFDNVNATVARYDAFQDWPWPLIYKYLDRQWPGSKFILTLRKSPEKWLESIKKHSLTASPRFNARKIAYGYHYPFGHEAEYMAAYRRHEEAVREYFRDRPDDLLVLNWDEGDGWDELCAFLGCERPRESLPHMNAAEERFAQEAARAIGGLNLPCLKAVRRRLHNIANACLFYPDSTEHLYDHLVGRKLHGLSE